MIDNSTAQPVPPRRSRFGNLLDALSFADFRVLWLSTISNQLGQGMQQVLLGFLIFEMTESGSMVGAVFAVRSAPNLVIGLAAGPITDRLDRRGLMRISVIGMALASGAAALLLFTGQLTVSQLMVFAFALGILQAFYMTARQVYVYDLVGGSRAVNGIALISLAQRLGGAFGALLAGGAMQWWGAGASFLIMTASYGLGALALYWLRHAGDTAPQTREPMAQNLLNYFRTLRTNRVVLCLIISTAAAETFGFSHQVMLPILARDVLHIGPGGLGVLTAFRFLGGALGVFLLTAFGAIRRQGVSLLIFLALFGAGQMLLAISPNFALALLSVTFINMMASATDILHQTLLQVSVSNEQRGRAMGSWIVGIGTAPLGQLQVGNLAELTNSRLALLVNGAALAVVALAMGVLLPRLRKL